MTDHRCRLVITATRSGSSRQIGAVVLLIMLIGLIGIRPVSAEEVGDRGDRRCPDPTIRDPAVAAPPDAPTPGDSLRVGAIEIVIQPIFTADERDEGPGIVGFVRRLMDGIHIDTQRRVIRRELLFAPGETFDPRRLEQTERNLRGLGFVRNVRVAAVDTSAAGAVAIRITTQETWTLETSFSLALASDAETRWSAAVSEQNFLGRGLGFGVGFGRDENGSFQSVFLSERRLFGGDWRVNASLAERSDGYDRRLQLDRPFYEQEQSWGLTIELGAGLRDERYYLSHAGPAGADRSEAASLYGRFPYERRSATVTGLHRLGDGDGERIWRLGLGAAVSERNHDLASPIVTLADGRRVDLSFLEEGTTPLAREDGVTVWPHLVLTTESRVWTQTRYLLRYGLVEDVPLGPNVELRAGPNGRAVGSTAGFGERWRFELEGASWIRIGGGFLLVSTVAAATLGRRADRNWRASLLSGGFLRYGDDDRPWQTQLVAEAGRGHDLIGFEAFTLGLNRGLRTLGFDGQAGDRLYRWSVEQSKVLPFDLFGFATLGLAAFYAGGGAWFEGEDRSLADARHELGCGLRVGPLRSSSSQKARLDLTWDASGGGPVLTAVTQSLF